MQFKNIWQDRTPFRKLIILSGLCVASVGVLTLAATIMMKPLFGINAISNPGALSNTSDPNVIYALKFLQLFNALGLFVVPPFVFKYLCGTTDKELLQIQSPPKLLHLLMAALAIILATPLINLMAEINAGLRLPHFLSGLEEWMKSSEENAAKITEAFLKTDSVAGLLFNLFLIAVLPGLGEELLFRGTLQPLFARQTNSIIAGIIISAMVFSALHMQFYGFVPRMAMGVLFGFFMVWTKSLWVPAFAHFVNNGAAVLAAYWGSNEKSVNSFGATASDWYFSLLSAVGVGAIVFWMYKNRIK